MAKTQLEKALEKQAKETQKAAREARIRERASAIVTSQRVVILLAKELIKRYK